ncbi:PD-(D/E)XK nuclease family protein [Myroides odoratimimus]|uniref:PDDEXK-like family protein n=1 Tax=Myroides odoratimimus TaxID=76832 RepID=UPI002578E7A2|nr:PD-(D/E)XK nuclease family protein [Myroides odoratimimus]MDM1094958.1 PD-(D/E)XK nuclease family protein [Myroides odoratimimus]
MNQDKHKDCFLQQLDQVSNEYNLSNYNQFNIFRVMFKLHDEKYLHSRFISFLLDPKGSHGQGTRFLALFLEVMEISGYSLEGATVDPNELNRGEVYNIDILIKNKHSHVIIIENKVFAKDQTKTEETDPYLKYQLPRYYHKMVLDSTNDKHEVVRMIYLTIDGKNPEFFEQFPDDVRKLIKNKEHLSDIAKWLDLCLTSLSEESDLKRSIEHYKQARFEFLNDVKLALSLKNRTEVYYEEAKEFWQAEYKDIDLKYHILKDQFKHVKWHTVYDFYVRLKEVIGVAFIDSTIGKIDKEQITKLTHGIDSKTITVLVFEVYNIPYYVCNDNNGFSIGRNVKTKSKDDFQYLFKEKNYKYFDFSEEDVFALIKPENRDELVEDIVVELKVFLSKSK